MYQKVLNWVNGGEALSDEPYFVCQQCGYTVGGEAPEKCPICGAPREMFKQID